MFLGEQFISFYKSKLNEIFTLIKDELEARARGFLQELLENHEFGVFLEILQDNLIENEVPVSEDFIERIQESCLAFKVEFLMPKEGPQ